MPTIPLGLYRHWKGGTYNVVGVALHRDSGQQWVVYHRADCDDRSLEVKLLGEFTERIERDGYVGPRYRLTVSNMDGPFLGQLTLS